MELLIKAAMVIVVGALVATHVVANESVEAVDRLLLGSASNLAVAEAPLARQ